MISSNDNYGFILGKIVQKMESEFNEKISHLNIDSRHYGLLIVIYENENISQKNAGEILKIDRTTIMHRIDYLEGLKYVERVQNPEDRRSYRLKLTKKSKKLIKPLWNTLKEVEIHVLKNLNSEQKVAFKKICSITLNKK